MLKSSFGMLSNPRPLLGNRISLILILSYAFDWIIVILAAVTGVLFAIITPNKRPFSLANTDISFPHVREEKVPMVALVLCSLGAPVVVIFLVATFLVPGPTVSKTTPQSLIWRRKLWELHTGLLGLALSLAVSFVITSGMKNLFGKPRPDLLSRCDPDLDNFSQYVIGDYSAIQRGVALVSATICQNTDDSVLDDGFRSFPSGHASFSAAGLIYLSLFIASKLAITIPFLAPRCYSKNATHLYAFPSRISKEVTQINISSGQEKRTPVFDDCFSPPGQTEPIIASRNQAAAPPVYLLVFAAVPFFTSIYISSTRWSDFRHHGFDILFGYLIGIITAIFAFRWYHLPISQGAGWSWGPRSSERSFWAGVGVGNYAGEFTRTDKIGVTNDVEARLTDSHDVGVENGHTAV